MNSLLSTMIGAGCILISTTAMSATWVGIEAGVGSSHYETVSDNIDVSWTGAIYIGYDFSPTWGLSVGAYTGSGSSVPKEDIGVATEAEEELDYSAVSVNANWRFSLSTSQSLYASLGVNYNQTEVSLQSVKTIDESGVGYTVRAGWQYHFNNHYTISAGVQRLGLSEVDVNSANIGLTYRF